MVVSRYIAACLFMSYVWGQAPATETPEHQSGSEQISPEKAESESAPTAADAERVRLNILGKVNTDAGESRRNENVQFNLVDNNALKELNVRLGTTATIISEFRAERSYFGAEFGNPPSEVIHVGSYSQRGFHGDLHYMHLNSIFSARSFFQVGDVKPARENRYGFNLGAEGWKGAYWFLSGGQEKLRGSVNGNVLVPAPDERTPLTTDPDKRAVIERYLAAYPKELPNRTDINPRALNTNAPQVIDHNTASIGLDQDLGAADRLLLRYRFFSQAVDAFQLVAGQNPDTDTRSHAARITWNRVWSPAAITDFTLGFDRLTSLLVPEENAVGPLVLVAGLSPLGPSGNIPIDRAINLFRGGGLLQRQAGGHILTAGFDVTRRQYNGTETDVHRGFFSFSNDFGRTGIENLRWGTPSQHIISIGHVHRGFRNWDLQFHANDEWQVAPNFTLSVGLRYAPVTRPIEVDGWNVVPYDCDCNNVAPRFGFAWRLGEGRGVIRGAYGLQYGEIFPVTYGQIRFSPPGSVKIAVPAPDLLDPLGLESGHPRTDALENRYLLDPELATPYSHQYNFSWEFSLRRTWRLQLGYVGSRSHKLLIMWYLNRAHPVPGIPQTTATINQRRPIPDLAEIRYVLNGSRGYFDAARVSLVVPRFHGFSIDAGYWFSKAIDLGASYTNTAAGADSRLSRSQWEFETHKDRKALSDFDQPHAFLVRAAYETPAAGWSGWLGKLLGGWTVTGIALLKSGTPFAVTTFDGPGFGNVDGNGGDRPNLADPSILGRTIGDPDTSVERLPASAFYPMKPTDPAGNLGYNVFRKGKIANVNASLGKTWEMARNTRLSFRAESINLFNTPQFAEPGNRWGAPEFGFITNTLNDGRTFRFLVGFGW